MHSVIHDPHTTDQSGTSDGFLCFLHFFGRFSRPVFHLSGHGWQRHVVMIARNGSVALKGFGSATAFSLINSGFEEEFQSRGWIFLSR